MSESVCTYVRGGRKPVGQSNREEERERGARGGIGMRSTSLGTFIGCPDDVLNG